MTTHHVQEWTLRRLMAASIIALVAFGLPYQPVARATTPFIHETVTSAGGSHVSLALDTRDGPHISYYRTATGDLYYAEKVAGKWAYESVDFFGDRGQYTSLALDVDGSPHISYYDVTNGDLRYAAKTSSEVWATETVDVAGDVGRYSSLALDGSADPHIGYYDVTNDDLKYATKSGGTWTIEIVDATGNVGQYVSLALDNHNNPHISYSDNTNGDLKYASKSGGSWIIETVDALGNVGAFASLAVDAQGNPSISYFDNSNGYLKYATKSGLSWATETVDTGFGVGGFTSLALDAEANPHISYYDLINTGLKYAVKSSGAWTTETIDATGDVGSFTSIALDAQDNPRISYYDAGNDDLKYTDSAVQLEAPIGGERWATGTVQTVRWRGTGPVSVELSENGGLSYSTLLSSVSENQVVLTVPGAMTDQARVRITRGLPFSTSESPGYFQVAPDLVSPWWSEAVDTPAEVGWYPSLALDSGNKPHISYYDAPNGDLKYAMRNGGAWAVESVDATGNVGGYTSLALDAQDNPHISYVDDTNADLKYASKSGGTWMIETVDATASVGASATSLALDAAGNPHISYCDSTAVFLDSDLKYAAKSGGTWTIETVQSAGNTGYFSSLALDAQGNPHISYDSFDAQALSYASKSGGMWTIEIVDESGGYSTSLALGSYDAPHIGYFGSGRAKYATKHNGTWAIETIEYLNGDYSSLALDGQDNPRVIYRDFSNGDLRYAERHGGTWTIENVDTPGSIGEYASLALDAQDNPHVGALGNPGPNLKYFSAGLGIVSPLPGDVWPVGGIRQITWDGTGRVDLSLSTDGGNSWQVQQPGLTSGEYQLQVPHTPSRFAKLKLERAIPHTFAVTDLFTIETSVSLLAMLAAPLPDGAKGATISWQTDPGPKDLAGYRLERAMMGSPGWRTIIALTPKTSVTDPDGGPGSRYRLFAVNGLGEEIWLGEAGLRPLDPIAAWPLPYRRGELTVSFATAGGLGGGTARTELAVFDVRGRLVRRIDSGNYSPGYRIATWDGRDSYGRDVATGIYFVRASGELGYERSLKVTVLR